MTAQILILRPHPGSAETASRAAALGMEAVAAPLFAIGPEPWEMPDPAGFDSVLITSANAARCGGDGLARFVRLPCYAVGESSAAAARGAGFEDIRIGPGDGAALVAMMEKDGMSRAFHPCGRDHVPLQSPSIAIERRVVYAAEPVRELSPEAVAAIEKGALVLLHSPRAAYRFASLSDTAGLARNRIGLAAISDAAAGAAGLGWKSVAVAPAPRDHALLELAAKLCQTGGKRSEPEE